MNSTINLPHPLYMFDNDLFYGHTMEWTMHFLVSIKNRSESGYYNEHKFVMRMRPHSTVIVKFVIMYVKCIMQGLVQKRFTCLIWETSHSFVVNNCLTFVGIYVARWKVLDQAYNRYETQDKRPLGRDPERSWCHCHTNVKLFWSQPVAPWSTGCDKCKFFMIETWYIMAFWLSLGRPYRRWKDQFLWLQNGNWLPKTAIGRRRRRRRFWLSFLNHIKKYKFWNI